MLAPVAQRLVQHLVAIRCVGHGIYMRPYSFACPLTYRALAGAANLVEMPGNSICAGAHVHSTSRMRHLSRRVSSSPIPHNSVRTSHGLDGLEQHLYHSNEHSVAMQDVGAQHDVHKSMYVITVCVMTSVRRGRSSGSWQVLVYHMRKSQHQSRDDSCCKRIERA